ncbi:MULTISPECIES: LysR family transcriptional regulator [unclassified Pseudoalteromonas]|uniref:LysR family transcriptional regulator n=1 Tax=unclassified Pseudoalteromonas TaxID=194690 RepID=UPI000CF627B0|nr:MULTISPECIES: LysR family transcriptional regulator [unclassified Pseudoalteromonas]
MSIHQLRTFVEVYRQRSFSKAADVLHITQPAVSSHIASLESQLDHRLFVRHVRGVRPTRIADELAIQLGDTLDYAEGVLAKMKSHGSKIDGVIHINGPIDMLSSMLAPKLQPLTDAGAQIRLHPSHDDDMFTFLKDGNSDFALCLTPPEDGQLDYCLLGEERVFLVASPARARQMSQDLELVLSEQPLVAYDLGRTLVRQWVSHNGLFLGHLNEIITAPDLRCLRTLVLAGLGWSVLPEYLVNDDLKHERLVAIGGSQSNPAIQYHLCWRAGALRSPRIARAQQLLRGVFTP